MIQDVEYEVVQDSSDRQSSHGGSAGFEAEITHRSIDATRM